MEASLVQLSKTVSHALRHAPAQYQLVLDAEGWVAVEDLLAALHRRRREWQGVTEADLRQVLAQSEKQRFEIKEGKIRAFYGHSIPQKIKRTPSPPPAMLYHGTTVEAARLILVDGLKPMSRQNVHLSADIITAQIVGRRRTPQPVILVVHAMEAARQGVNFYLGNEGVWLADDIPPGFITQM